MDTQARYRINLPLVACQEIEGEAILIHFDTGCYYSANATGARVIAALQAGLTVEAIGRDLATCFATDAGAALSGAGAFIESLAAEGLIASADAQPADAAAGAAPPRREPATMRFPWTPPELLRFDDLQDLLMLDPIHDVDQAGWPLAPPDPEPPSGVA